ISTVLTQLTGITLSIQVRDQAKVAKALDPAMGIVNRMLAQAGGPGGNGPEFRKQAGDQPSYVLEVPPGLVPPQFQGLYQPTISLAKDQLIISATTAGAERAVAASTGGPDKRWRPTGAFGSMARRLPNNLMMLNVNDPRESMPTLIENLPAVAQQLG